jgi:hypothetical protein
MRALQLLLFLLLPLSVHSQPRGHARLTGGFSWFLDDGDTRHYVVGGSAGVYLTRRFGIEPEFVYMHHSLSDEDYVATFNVFRDIGGGQRARPYAILGAGVLHNRNNFIRFSSTEATIHGGFGARVYLTRRLFIAPEFRLGWETIFRFTGSIGYTFGER